MSRSGVDHRARFHAAIERSVRHLGGDRAAADASGVSKSVWYDAKRGRAIPDNSTTWPAMRRTLAGVPVAVTGVTDWDELYDRVAGGSRRSDAVKPRRGRDGTTPRQLPPGIRTFLGRAAELRRLDELLAAPPTVGVPIAVVAGPPGVGKTSLAVHWASRRAGDFPDGILYADLRGWSIGGPARAEEILPGWLRAFGVDPTTVPDDPEGRSALLRTLLSDRRILVVLDNVGTEEQVRPLLPATASAAVLLTSRSTLPGLAIQYGAELVRLRPLSDVDGVELLRQALGTHRAAADLTALADLCAGLPLTLRIVAETIRTQPSASLSTFVTALADEPRRLALLAGDDPGTDPRTVVSWSHHQLRDEVAATFERLGLMPGTGIHGDAAAAVADVGRDTAAAHLRVLDRLNLAGLTADRRIVLHDLVHLYAAEVAQTSARGELPIAARRRLFDYYLHTAARADELVEPLRYRIELPGTTVEATAFDTLVEALAWLDAELPTMVSLCAQDLPELDAVRWRLAFLLRGYFFRTRRLFEWTATHEAAVRAAIRCGDRQGEALSRSNLGVAWHQRDDDAAMEQYRRARTLFAELGDVHGTANIAAHEAAVHRRRGNYTEALASDHRALAIYRAADNRRNVAITLRGIGMAEAAIGRTTAAAASLEQSRDLARDLGMHMDAARAASGLGRLYLRAGDTGAAERAFLDAIDSDGRWGGRFETAMAMHGLGAVAFEEGRVPDAKRSWTEALAMLEDMGSPRAEEVRADLRALPGE